MDFLKKIGGNPWASCFRPIHHCKVGIQQLIIFFYPIIEGLSLLLSIFAKNYGRKYCKRHHCVKGSKSRELGKEVSCIYFKNFKNYFLLLKWNFKNKIIIWQPRG
jgi:hypothetical protein